MAIDRRKFIAGSGAVAAVVGAGTYVTLQSSSFPAGQDDTGAPWRFLVMADIHNAEDYVHINGSPRTQTQRLALRAEHIQAYSALKQEFGGELVMLPGDTNSGKWATPGFRNGMGDGNLSLRDAILKYSHWCYNNPRLAFRDAGYENIHVAVGDHEIGDNDWPTGVRANAVSHHKDGFNETFIKKAVRPFYDDRNGSTRVKNSTSYAVRHNNAVLITLDQFDQPDQNSDGELHGTVAGRLSSDLLSWLEDRLIEADANPEVERIIVQGHLPVLYPVRAERSSTMVYEGADSSAMWQLFRQYGVDLYLCGEVHANTVIVDPGGPVQISSRAFRNYSWAVIVDIETDGISAFAVDDQFNTIGTVSIPDTGTVTGAGILAPIDMSEPLIDWVPVPVTTGATTTFGNAGQFAPYHASESGDCDITVDQGYVAGESEGCVFGEIPPLFRNGYEGTVEVEFKASAYEDGIIVSVTRAGGNHIGTGFAAVQYSDRIELYMDGATATAPYCFTADDTHKLRIVHETGGNLHDLAVYIDGNPLTVSWASGNNKPVYAIGGQYRMAAGGAYSGAPFLDETGYDRFRSEIYGLKVWGRALHP